MTTDDPLDLGWKLYRERKYDDAIAELKIATTGSNPALAHWRLAFCYRRSSRPESALGHFKRAVELAPEEAWTHRELGLQTAQLGDLHGALAHFARSLERDPMFPQTFHDTAACLGQLDFFELSLICYTICGVLCDVTKKGADTGVSFERYFQSVMQLQRVLGATRFSEIQLGIHERMELVDGPNNTVSLPAGAPRSVTEEIVLPALRKIAGT